MIFLSETEKDELRDSDKVKPLRMFVPQAFYDHAKALGIDTTNMEIVPPVPYLTIPASAFEGDECDCALCGG